MTDITKTLFDIRALERNAQKKTPVGSLHAAAKLIVLICYIVCVASCARYDIGGLLVFSAYPILLTIAVEPPLTQLFGRLLIVLPFVAAACVANVFIHTEPAFYLGELPVSYGFLSFVSALLKALLTVWAALLFVAATSVSDMVAAMRQARVPDSVVTQGLLVYRYLDLLAREGAGVYTAYKLRAPGQKGVKLRDMGSFLGGMLLRAVNRGERVYHAMQCRGYGGGSVTRGARRFSPRDICYIGAVCAALTAARVLGAENLIGGLFV